MWSSGSSVPLAWTLSLGRAQCRKGMQLGERGINGKCVVTVKCKWRLIQAGYRKAFKVSAMTSSQTVKIFVHIEMRDLDGEEEVLRNLVFYDHEELGKKRFLTIWTIWKGPQLSLGTWGEGTGRGRASLVMLFSGSAGRMFWASFDRVSACDRT